MNTTDQNSVVFYILFSLPLIIDGLILDLSWSRVTSH